MRTDIPCMHVEIRSQKSSLPGLLSILSLEARSLPDPGDSQLSTLTERSSRSPPAFHPQPSGLELGLCGHTIMFNLFMCAWDLNSNPYVCAAKSTFSTSHFSSLPFVISLSFPSGNQVPQKAVPCTVPNCREEM